MLMQNARQTSIERCWPSLGSSPSLKKSRWAQIVPRCLACARQHSLGQTFSAVASMTQESPIASFRNPRWGSSDANHLENRSLAKKRPSKEMLSERVLLKSLRKMVPRLGLEPRTN